MVYLPTALLRPIADSETQQDGPANILNSLRASIQRRTPNDDPTCDANGNCTLNTSTGGGGVDSSTIAIVLGVVYVLCSYHYNHCTNPHIFPDYLLLLPSASSYTFTAGICGSSGKRTEKTRTTPWTLEWITSRDPRKTSLEISRQT